jgi:hypothetical protein
MLVLAIIALLSSCSSESKHEKQKLADEFKDEKQELANEFKDEKQELAYLESLSNPTPVQWKRREELRVAKKDWAPDVGSQIALPAYVIALDVYDSLDARRRATALDVAGMISSPEWNANDKYRVTSLFAGDKLRILEIGDDYVCVEMLVDNNGEPKRPRSNYPGDPDLTRVYSPRWWDPNAAGVMRDPRFKGAKRG